MINELYSLLTGLEEINQDIPIKHNDIQAPGKKNLLRVCLTESGLVHKVESIKKNVQDIWTIGDGNKNQFPAVKLNFPLRPEGHIHFKEFNIEKKSEKQYLDKIKSLREEYPVKLPENLMECPVYRARIAQRKDQLISLKGTNADCIFELYKRFLTDDTKGIAVLESLDKAIWNECQNNANIDFLKIAASVLFGNELDAKGMFKENAKITLLFDLAPDLERIQFATSRHFVSTISQALNTLNTSDSKTGICPITAKNTSLLADKFPKEKLPILGNVILCSRFDGSGNHSVRRYNRANIDSYSISAELASKLAAALLKLTDEKYQGMIWDKVPSESKSPDLLIAFCASDFNLRLAPFFTGFHKDEFEGFDDYKEYCKKIIEIYKGKDLGLNQLVNFIVIRKINDGNQKIIFSSSYTIKQLKQAAESWSKACKNASSIRLKVIKYKDINKDKYCKPWVVEPTRFIAELKNHSLRDGKGIRFNEVQSIDFSQVVILFLGNNINQKKIAERLLPKLNRQFKALLEFVAQARIQAKLAGKALLVANDKDNTAALTACTLIGLILFKIGRKEEIYMNNFAYKLGQFFAAVDELHIKYCKYVRKGQIPNVLIGNQAYGMALKISSEKVLSQLALRLRPYHAWASRTIESEIKDNEQLDSEKQEQDKKDRKKIRYLNYWIKKQSGILFEYTEQIQNTPTDIFRAELMLGYLAGRPRFIKRNETENTTNLIQEGAAVK